MKRRPGLRMMWPRLAKRVYAIFVIVRIKNSWCEPVLFALKTTLRQAKQAKKDTVKRLSPHNPTGLRALIVTYDRNRR